jgi:hypothetical protein
MMISTKSIPVPFWVVIGIIVTYLGSMVAAGHGVIPVALLLILGWEFWFIPVLLGWIGIVFLLGGKLFDRLKFCRQFGVATILASWVIFLWNSDILMNLISSIPFFICLVYWGKLEKK